MDQRDKDLLEKLGGIGVEVPPEFQATVAKLMTLGRNLGSVAAHFVVDREAPANVRYLCLPFATDREALLFTCDLIDQLGYGTFLTLAPFAVGHLNGQFLVAFLGVPCIVAAVH